MKNSSPLNEMGERAAEAIPGLVAAPKLAAIDAYRKQMADARRRIHDGHRAQMQALGISIPDLPEDDMGNLIICGDIQTENPASLLQAMQGQSPLPSAGLTGWKKYAAIAALAAGGPIAGYGVAKYLSPEPPAAVDTDTQYELRLGE